MSDFPMTAGVDLRNLKTPPEGARSDVYKTSLLYRNIHNDSVLSFNMENFPKDGNWTFVSSHSEKIESGFVSPLEDFKMFSTEGEELSGKILQDMGDVFLISVKEPHNLDPDILQRLNKMSVLGASLPQGPVFFYAITGLKSDQIYGFKDSFITPITFCSGPVQFVESISGKGVSLIHIKNGKVTGRWDNGSIPEPDELQKIVTGSVKSGNIESFVMPYILSQNTNSIEEKRVYILILGFLFLTLFIRVFLEDPFMKPK